MKGEVGMFDRPAANPRRPHGKTLAAHTCPVCGLRTRAKRKILPSLMRDDRCVRCRRKNWWALPTRGTTGMGG